MDPREEAASLKENPLPDCSTCAHRYETEAACELLDKEVPCKYQPDELHDGNRPPLRQAYLIHQRISALQDELKGYQARYDVLIEKAADAKIEKEGPYTLIDKKRTVRVPDPEKFRATFPAAYATIKQEEIDRQMKKIDEVLAKDLSTIPVKRAEELVGKVPLADVCGVNVYHSYSIEQIKEAA